MSLPPHDLDAEAAVLSAIMIDPSQLDECDGLRPEDFYSESHRRVYEAALELHANAQPCDMVQIGTWLKDHGRYEQVGGFSYLTEILNSAPAVKNCGHYALTVKSHSRRRGVILALQQAAAKAYQPAIPLPEIVDQVSETAHCLVTGDTDQTVMPMHEALKVAIKSMMAEKGSLVSTGIQALDAALGGMGQGDQIVVAARPGMGKSAFAMGIATSVVANPKHGAMVFSLEMPKEQLAMRTLSSRAGADLNAIRAGRITSEGWKKLAHAAQDLGASMKNLVLDDSAGTTVTDIRMRARREQRRLASRGVTLKLVVVDYIQLVQATEGDNREQEVARISSALKRIARELKVTVLALSQLNRGVEMRSDKRPMLSDLRESGSIEQDADAVLMLYRDEYYNREKSSDPGVCEVNIAKQRNGPTGVVRVGFHASTASFYNLLES